jgi:hypothetical protein
MNIKKWFANHPRLIISCFALAVLTIVGAIMYQIIDVVETEHQAFDLALFCNIAPPQDAIDREAMRPKMAKCVQNAAQAVATLNDEEASLLSADPFVLTKVERINSAANAKMAEFRIVKSLEKKFFPSTAG